MKKLNVFLLDIKTQGKLSAVTYIVALTFDLLELDIGDKFRRTSNSKSGLGRQVGNWLKRHNVNPDNVLEEYSKAKNKVFLNADNVLEFAPITKDTSVIGKS